MDIEIPPHDVEDFEDQGIANRVKNLVPSLAIYNNMLGAQDGQVLGCIRLLDSQAFDQRAGGELAIAKLLDDCNACGVGEGLKEVGLEAAEGILHNRIFDNSNIPDLLPGYGFGDELAVGEIHLEFLTLGAFDDLDAMGAYGQGHVYGRLLGMFAAVDQDSQSGRIR